MDSKFQRIVIVGATSSIADHCTKLWLTDNPTELILIGRDSQKLNELINDYKVRSPKTLFQYFIVDFLNSNDISKLIQSICDESAVDLVLIAHGSLPDQSMAQKDLVYNAEQIQINAISPVIFAESFVNRLHPNKPSTIAIIGSVAGDRGRKSNYVYGAAKGLVTRYAQGLQHRFANTNVSITLIKPGPTNTPMTSAMKGSEKFASPEEVAKLIVSGIESKKTVVYAPSKWWLIMMVIRHLPNFIFNKLNI